MLDLSFGAQVDVEVELAAQAVLGVLAVLAHHDDRRLDGGEHREKQIKQDEGIGIPGLAVKKDIDGRVDEDGDGEGDDEVP